MTEINVVLVRSIYPANIGSCARAMANMGGHRLILIDPKCELNFEARKGAAGAQEDLAKCTCYKTWADFYSNEGSGLRIGFTRRIGKGRRPEAFEQILSREWPLIPESLPLYLIFGPEDDGLSADDLAFLNCSASLPTFGEFKSLNISHAVLLALFMVQSEIQKGFKGAEARAARPKFRSKRRPLVFPDQSLRDWLTAMGFDIDARKASAYLTLRRLLLRNQPHENELMVLEAILQQNIRKLRGRALRSPDRQ